MSNHKTPSRTTHTICPLMSFHVIDPVSGIPVIVECLEEKCELWDREHWCCVVVGLKIEAVKP